LEISIKELKEVAKYHGKWWLLYEVMS
jgi:hypothetical protein